MSNTNLLYKFVFLILFAVMQRRVNTMTCMGFNLVLILDKYAIIISELVKFSKLDGHNFMLNMVKAFKSLWVLNAF